MPARTYVGGQPATFVCVHIIMPQGAQTPVMFTCSTKPDENLRDQVQPHHWETLVAVARYWVPDRSLANRLVTECRKRCQSAVLRAIWYDMRADEAERVIVQAAKDLVIPVLSDVQHDGLRLTSEQRGDLLARRAGVFR